jgi:hypothetical protein
MTIRGIIRGRMIELVQEPGIPDGQEVTVIVLAQTQAESVLPPGEGLRRSAGTWDDNIDGLNKYLEWNRQQRKRSRPEATP